MLIVIIAISHEPELRPESTNRMKEPTDKLQAPDIKLTERGGKKFMVHIQCTSCKMEIKWDLEREAAMAAGYDKLFKTSKKCEVCTAAKSS